VLTGSLSHKSHTQSMKAAISRKAMTMFSKSTTIWSIEYVTLKGIRGRYGSHTRIDLEVEEERVLPAL